MKPTISTLSLAVAALGVSVSLAGCSMGAAFPEASANPEQTPLGTIQGSNYGGHAPLVGSHVYVLQPSVTTAAGTSGSPQYNAYGAQATSKLTSNSSVNASGGYATTQNTSDPGIPTSWYYITTDATGSFNISGDYTCTVGLPVYLYIYGGTPSYPSTTNTVSITSANVTSSYITFTTANQNAYVGEGEYFSNLPAGGPQNLNYLDYDSPYLPNYSSPVLATGLSNTQFSIINQYGTTSGTQSTPGATVTFLPTPNPGVVNLAVLGNCPSTGSLAYNSVSNPTGLKFVYVNEVSTVAAAYAFKPFALKSNNNATYIGTSSTNIAGLQNAAITAGLLYDIQGSNTSTTYAGEGHIARSATPAANGIVPQATIDEIANILAACVDSNNTSTTIGSGGISTPCSTLFTNATNTGIPTTSSGSGVNAPGTAPVDTAQAAINIARFPGGPPYSYSSTGSSTFMSNLLSIPTGNVPFSPYVGSGLNDFSVAIAYTSASNTQITGPESLAIDKLGNVWATSQGGSGVRYFYELSPSGVISNSNTQSGYIYGYVAIDTSGDPWTGAATSSGPQTYLHVTNPTVTASSGALPVSYSYSSSTASTTYPTGPAGSSSVVSSTYGAFGDSSSNMYFTYQNGTSDSIVKYPGNSTSPTGTTTAAFPSFTNSVQIAHAKIDAAGYVYVDQNGNTSQISRQNITNGANYTSGTWPINNTTTGCTSLSDPEEMAVTRTGDAIFAGYGNGSGTSLFYITAGGACTQLANSSLNAGFNAPFGVAIDGNDYAFITNRGTTSISEVDTSAGTAAGTVAISPSGGYSPQTTGNATILANPLNIAIDPSGNVWTTNYAGNAIVEIVGLAAPTTEPLSAAAIPLSYTQGSIGYKP